MKDIFPEEAAALLELLKKYEDSLEHEPVYDDEDAIYVMKQGLKRSREEVARARNRMKKSNLLEPDRFATKTGEITSLILKFLLEFFTANLQEYEKQTLCELRYFETGAIQKTFDAQPRSVIISGLEKSYSKFNLGSTFTVMFKLIPR